MNQEQEQKLMKIQENYTQEKLTEFKEFHGFEVKYFAEIEDLLRSLVAEIHQRTSILTKKQAENCVITKCLHLEGQAYMELHKNNIQAYKKYIGVCKDLLNLLLNQLLFKEDKDVVVAGVTKSSSSPEEAMKENEMALSIADMMKKVEFNYQLSLTNYITLLKKPDGYDEFMAEVKSDIDDEVLYEAQEESEVKDIKAEAPVPAPEKKKKKKKGKKKKGGKRR